MKKRRFSWGQTLWGLTPWVICLACGCAPLLAPVLVAAGAVGGYAASRDSVTMDLDHPWDQLWQAAVEESKAQGFLKRENPKRGRLDARIQDTDVVITLKQLTPSTVRVVVRARKNLLPRVDVAQRIAVTLLQRVEKSGQLF